MKKILLGFIFGVVTATGVSVMANGLIEKAEFIDVGVRFNGEQLELNQQLLRVQAQGSDNVNNYMPVRGVLEGMGYTVDWNGGNNMIEISSSSTNEVGNGNLINDKQNEWISRIEVTSTHGYDTAQGANGAGVFLNKNDTEPLFFSEVGAEVNLVRIIRDGNDFKFNRQDLLDLGIDLTHKE